MKKKFTGIIMAVLMLCMTVLTGCSLVTKNWDKYYNTIVATITDQDNNKINITKKELITAYNSYGYYFEQYYGNTRKEAIEATLEQLESRKLTIKAAEKMFAEENDGEILTKREKSYLWHQTNDALEANLMTYVDQVTGNSTSNEDETADDGVISYEAYKHKATLEDGNKIMKTESLAELLSDFDYDEDNAKDIAKKEDKDLIYDNLIHLVNSVSGSVYSEAFNEYRKALVASEEGLKVNGTKVTDRFAREIDRIYQINYENYIVEKYLDSFKDKTTLSDVTVNQMLELYSGKVMSSYTQYVLEGDSDYEEDVLSDLGKIYYFKDGKDATNFYTVSHVLFKFSDEAKPGELSQSARFTDAKTKLENGTYTQTQYNEVISDLYDEIIPTVRYNNNGIYEEDASKTKQSYETSVTALYNHIVSEVDKGTTGEEKAQIFNEFIYKYNEDPGIMNADYNYVMGVNKSQANDATEDEIITLADGRTYKSYSKMVSEFTLAGAELYNDGLGQIGDLSGMVATENGIHILMYTGECKNYFDSIVNGYELSEGAIETLTQIKLNVCTNKTMFDLLYEELTKDNFSSFESANIGILRENCKFDRFEKAYKDLFKE